MEEQKESVMTLTEVDSFEFDLDLIDFDFDLDFNFDDETAESERILIPETKVQGSSGDSLSKMTDTSAMAEKMIMVTEEVQKEDVHNSVELENKVLSKVITPTVPLKTATTAKSFPSISCCPHCGYKNNSYFFQTVQRPEFSAGRSFLQYDNALMNNITHCYQPPTTVSSAPVSPLFQPPAATESASVSSLLSHYHQPPTAAESAPVSSQFSHYYQPPAATESAPVSSLFSHYYQPPTAAESDPVSYGFNYHHQRAAAGSGSRSGSASASASAPLPSAFYHYYQQPGAASSPLQSVFNPAPIPLTENQERRSEDEENCGKNKKRWTEEEHRLFLEGLKVYGAGKWKKISKEFIRTKSHIQIASHAQKYHLRQQSQHLASKRRSIHDIRI